MNINYSELRIDRLAYKIKDTTIYIKTSNTLLSVDLSGLEDGVLSSEIPYISKLSKNNGTINATLRKPVDVNGIEIKQNNFDVEGAKKVKFDWKTQREVEDEKLLEDLKPSQDEVNDAELEIKIITLLTELEVL